MEPEPGSSLEAMLIVFYYESKILGTFNRICFADARFRHPAVDRIDAKVFCFDYLPSSEPNHVILEKIHPFLRKQEFRNRGARKRHVDPNSVDMDTLHCEIKLDYQAYVDTLQKWQNRPDIPQHLKQSAMFRFLAFVTNERHRNRTLLSHFGGR